ncbi:T9SS type A sorting domain-containing protein [bacterium]|nr:T9SS type A sorting domain-containing protein [bacterium]
MNSCVRVFLFLTIMCSVLIVSVHADDQPIINLQEGRNEISFSIKNGWDYDLSGLKLEVNEEKIPSWLKITVLKNEINIPQKMSGNITLNFNISHAPDGSIAEIPFIIVDSNNNQWSYYLKIGVSSNENSAPHPIDILYGNFPNPFNPSTTITYSLAETRLTKLVIYNSLGQKVKTLLNESQEAGIHTIQWDGRNEFGQKVSSGIYLYQLISGSFIESNRMILLE